MANENPEAGLRNHRTEFARESEFGVNPTDPEFLKYSSTVTNFSWSSDSVNEPQRGLGTADPAGFLKGPESHELTVMYDLVKGFLDGSDPNDAAYDAMVRDSDQLIPNSHTIVDREDKQSINSNQTVNGSASYDTRIYTVAKGGLIDEAVMTGDPSDSQPVTIELTYLAQKVRSYQIDQPDASTFLTLKSSDASDTSVSVTIEDEGGNTSEDVSLDGSDATTVVSTSSEFEDIDVIELGEETTGDITVSINEGDDTSPTEGDELAVIKGADSYNGVEGDLGVPALGSGSHESLSDPAAEVFIGDTIERGGSPVPYEIPSAELTVANNIEETERSSGYGMALHPAEREITMTATMFGESMTHDMLVQHLTNDQQDVKWELDNTTITLNDCVLDEPGERAAEEGQAVMTTENVFFAEGITVA